MKILYFLIGIVVGGFLVSLHTTYEFYEKYSYALRYLEYISYLLHIKSYSINNETRQIDIELDGIHLSKKQMKSFKLFVLNLSYSDGRGITIISKNSATHSTPCYIVNQLCKMMDSATDTAYNLLYEHFKLNILSKLCLNKIYHKLENQACTIANKSLEIKLSKKDVISFF